ncbi:MAG: hypothetical protein ACFBSD_08960 [Paracoccaceae bacterium]
MSSVDKTRKPEIDHFGHEYDNYVDQRPTRETELFREKKFVTGRISDTCRFIGFGLMAAFYAIVSSGQAPTQEANISARIFLWVSGTAGVVTVFLDYLQYVAGLVATHKALNNHSGNFAYNKRWISYKMRQFLFVSKQLTAMSGGVALVIFMVYIL